MPNEADTFSSGGLVVNHISAIKFSSRPDCPFYRDRLPELDRDYDNEVWLHRIFMSFKNIRHRLRSSCAYDGDRREYYWWSEILPGWVYVPCLHITTTLELHQFSSVLLQNQMTQ